MFARVEDFWGRVAIPLPGGGVVSFGELISVALLLLGGYLASRLLGYLLARRLATSTLRPDVIFIVRRIVIISIFVLVLMTALSVLGIPLTAFAFASGAIAIGIGFGAQNIINNFISGWILMAERPIRINDFIEIDDAHGTVEEIGNRSTRIRRVDGVHLLVPNSLLLERTVVNWTLVDQMIRTSLRVGVAYGSPVREVAEIIRSAVTQQPEARPEPVPSVVFDDFGDNALMFEAYFWADVSGEKALREIRSEIRFRIDEVFAERGIVIAFPQRDVHLDARDALKVRILRDADREQPV